MPWVHPPPKRKGQKEKHLAVKILAQTQLLPVPFRVTLGTQQFPKKVRPRSKGRERKGEETFTEGFWPHFRPAVRPPTKNPLSPTRVFTSFRTPAFSFLSLMNCIESKPLTTIIEKESDIQF